MTLNGSNLLLWCCQGEFTLKLSEELILACAWRRVNEGKPKWLSNLLQSCCHLNWWISNPFSHCLISVVLVPHFAQYSLNWALCFEECFKVTFTKSWVVWQTIQGALIWGQWPGANLPIALRYIQEWMCVSALLAEIITVLSLVLVLQKTIMILGG